MIIPDENRSPDYWLMVARNRVKHAREELAKAERQFKELSEAIANQKLRMWEMQK